MSVRYLGHCAFLFEESTGESLLIDPFGNGSSEYDHWFLKPFPSLEVDLVAVTHDHFDHNAVSALPEGTSKLNGEGTRRVGNTTITGVSDIHSGVSGRSGMENVIYVIEHEGVRYCHIGDNRHDIPDGVVEKLGRIDALMVTVDDSCHLLTYQEVNQLVESLSPMVVIPMHYRVEGLSTAEAELEGPEGWVRTQSPRRTMRRSSFRIDRRGLPYEREVWTIPAELAG